MLSVKQPLSSPVPQQYTRVTILTVCFVIIATWAVTHLFTLDWGLPNYGSFAKDHAPPSYSADAQKMLELNGYKYPPLQHLLWDLIAPPIQQEAQTWNDRAILFSHRLYRYRLLGALMTLGTAILLWLISAFFFRHGFWALMPPLLFLLCPMSLYYSHTSNLDQPYLFWFIASCAVFLIANLRQKTTSTWQYWGCNAIFGVLMGFAFCTKDHVYAFYLPALMVFCLHRAIVGKRLTRVIGVGLLWTASFILTTWLIYLPVGGWDAFQNHLAMLREIMPNFTQVENTVSGRTSLFFNDISNIGPALDWPLVLMLLIAITALTIPFRYQKRNYHSTRRFPAPLPRNRMVILDLGA